MLSQGIKTATGKKSSSTASCAVPVELSAGHLADLRQAFDLFDVEGVGRIRSCDVRVTINALGCDVSKEELNQLLSFVGTDINGTMDFNDFLKLIQRKMNEQETRAEVLRTFRLLDQDHKGYLIVDDLRDAADLLDQDLTDDELGEMIQFVQQLTSEDHTVTSSPWKSGARGTGTSRRKKGTRVDGVEELAVTEEDFLVVMQHANVLKHS